MLWLVEHLPEDSATVAALRGGLDHAAEHRSWTSVAHLLATVADAVQLNTWATVAVNAKRRPKPPAPLPRPTLPRRVGRVVTVAEIAAAQETAQRETTGRG